MDRQVTARQLQRADLTILVDTREQHPWEFPAGFHSEPATLSTGDYSVRGLEDLIAVEREVP